MRDVWCRCAIAALVAVAAGGVARADPPPRPACADPAVLDQVADTLSARGFTITMERATAGEIPTVRANVVQCAVEIVVIRFDTDHYGFQPLPVGEIVHYQVMNGRNGFVVRVIDRPVR